LFPECGITTRLSWIGLSSSDFKLVTHYANSRFCKPNPGYYNEIFKEIGKKPQECLMVGNSPLEDMSVGKLGAETFLVNECVENESGIDVSEFRRGTLEELGEYLAKLK
jgi:FMN phosphatase YigB (HAD superfamily)